MSQEITVTRPSFWVLADDLAAYVESLVQVEAAMSVESIPAQWAILDEQREEISTAIDRLGAELATKTDSLAGVVRRLQSDAAIQREESDRMAARARASERAVQWLKDYAMRVMDEHGWKHMKTTANTIAIRGNSGVQPLVIDAPEKVPDELCWMEGSVRADIWKEMRNCYFESSTPPCELPPDEARMKRVPSNTLIREALAKDSDCPKCDGNGKYCLECGDVRCLCDADLRGCEACGGTGKTSVPGTHLEPRGRHLRLS